MSEDTPRLSSEERRQLLAVARGAIEAELRGQPKAPPPPGLGNLHGRGAFVTLHDGAGELRGCIGLIRSDEALSEVVRRMAVAAATSDRRFVPLGLDELPQARVEVSVLSPFAPIAPEAVEVGTHGLLIRARDRQGLLLPQVPVEHGWDRLAFLDHTCDKAGLPRATWRDPDTELLAFTAQVFGEGDEG
jgi:AmmeMemoRadiSam system protein A